MRSKKHFLVVDDSELSLRVTEMLLNSFGISGDYVSGADAAFTALSRRDYDLVLIDYLMPGMNGIETVEVIRRMAGSKNIVTEHDGWTTRTRDRKPSAHFEHSIAIHHGKPDILSSFEPIKEVLGERFI